MSEQVVIDSDGHVLEPHDMWLEYMPPELRSRAPHVDPIHGAFLTVDGLEVTPKSSYPGSENTFETKVAGADRYRQPALDGFSAHSQIEGMDLEGITAAVLFPSRGLHVMGVDGADSTVTTAAAHAYNSWLSDFISDNPNRLLGVGMIDPRDVNSAILEARRAIGDLGFVALFLRPNPVNGLAWHDAQYDRLWSAVQELGVPICFHEGSAVGLPQVATDRFDRHSFWHCVTHPVENQMAMLSVVLGGVTERYPELRFAFLECGAGWLPYWMWRLDEHVENEPHDFPYLQMKPSLYIQRQCFVSIDSDEDPGMAAIERFEDAHVVWGSDYPHPDGKFPNALRTLTRLNGMTADRLRQVVYEAPSLLFGDALASRLPKTIKNL